MVAPATPRKKIVQASLTPTVDKKRLKVKVKVPLTENIIFIGSEMYYDSFWLKMMFIGAAYQMAKHMRTADRIVIAYVDEGYTYLERLTIDLLSEQCIAKTRSKAVEVMKLDSSADITRLLNRARNDYKMLDVYFSSHGVVGAIDLSYKGKNSIKFPTHLISSVSASAFAQHGRLYSYACRTGVGVDDLFMGFENEAAAKPESSLAQKIADHFGIEVHAFLRRSFYGNVLREDFESETIVDALVAGRKTQGETQVIPISGEHEALPHPGLANKWGRIPKTGIPTPFVGGPKSEGTDNFAIWRKRGGRELPSAADSPTGVGSDMRIFKRTKK